MSEEERTQERLDILARFGPGVGEVSRRARERREANDDEGAHLHATVMKNVGTDRDLLGQDDKADKPSTLYRYHPYSRDWLTCQTWSNYLAEVRS